MGNKVLSIVIAARNDNYGGDFLYRFKTAMQMTIDGITSSGYVDDVEIVIVDWGSEIPLHTVVPSDGNLIRYIMVPSSVAQFYNQDSTFAVAMAINIGVRRCYGEYIAIEGADVIHSADFFKRLMPLIKGSGKYLNQNLSRCFCAIPLKHVPIEFLKSSPTVRDIDGYLHDNGEKLPFQEIMPFLFGAAGSLLMSRDMWYSMRGLDQRLIYWGWSDIDLALRARLKFTSISFGTDSGIYVYHLEHHTRPKDPLLDQISPEYFNPFTVNDYNWGAGDTVFDEVPQRKHDALPNIAGSIEISKEYLFKIKYLHIIFKGILFSSDFRTRNNCKMALMLFLKDIFRSFR